MLVLEFIHTYIHTYIHTCIHANMHTCIHTDIREKALFFFSDLNQQTGQQRYEHHGVNFRSSKAIYLFVQVIIGLAGGIPTSC